MDKPYYEYRDDSLKPLGLDDAENNERLKDFWSKMVRSGEKIRRVFSRTQGYMGISVNDWTAGHYQLANRLAFFYFPNRGSEVDALLVLVNYVGDTTYVVTGMEEWLSLYNRIFKDINIDHNAVLMDRLIMVFPLLSGSNSC